MATSRRRAWPFSGRFRVSRDSARSGLPRSLVGDERRRVVSRAGAPPPVSSRPGVDAIKEAGGSLPAASSCAACIDTEGLEPVCA